MQWKISRNSPIKCLFFVFNCCCCYWWWWRFLFIEIAIEIGKMIGTYYGLIFIYFHSFFFIFFRFFFTRNELQTSLPINKIFFFDKYHILFEWLHLFCNHLNFWHCFQCWLKNTGIPFYHKIWIFSLFFSLFFARNFAIFYFYFFNFYFISWLINIFTRSWITCVYIDKKKNKRFDKSTFE